MVTGRVVNDAELLAALLARLGGSVDLGRKELEAAKGWRLELHINRLSGDATLTLRE